MQSAEHKRKLIEQTRLERSQRSKNLEYGSGDSPRCRGEETELKESGEQFKAVFDNTLIGLYRTTPDGFILMANPELVKMLGYSSFDELAGRNLEREGYGPQYPRLAFKDRIENEGNVIGLESAWKKSDGTTLYVRESAHAVRDELGKTLYYQGTVEDITDRKKAEDALRDSEQRYRTLVDKVNIGVYRNTGGEQGEFLHANPAIAKMFGYDCPEDFMKVHVNDLYQDPGDRKRFVDKVSRKGFVKDMELRLKKRDGTSIWGSCTAQVTWNENGGIKWMDGVIEDITERNRTEEALCRRDAVLESVAFAADRFLRTGDWEQDIQKVLIRLGNASDVSRVYIFENHTDENGKLLTSQRYEWAASGISPQIEIPELQNFSFSDNDMIRWEDTFMRGDTIYGHVRNFPPAEQETLAAQDIQSIAAMPIFVEGNWWGFIGFDECRAEREWSAGELDALKVAANTLAAAIQRKDTENVLRDTERRLRALFDQTFQFIGLMTPDGTLIDANETALHFAGIEKSDVLNKPFWETPWWTHSPELQEQLREAVSKAATGQFVRFEATHQAADGSINCIDFSLKPVKDDKGNVTLLIPEGHDITERKRAEEALREAHEQLEERVRERTAELQHSKERFRLAAESTSDLIYEWDVSTGCIDWFGDVDGALGFEFGEFPRTLEAWAERIHPNDQLRLRDSVGRHRESTESISEEYQIQRKDGTWRYWTHYGLLVLDSEGQPHKWIGACNDITTRKHAEQAITESEEKFRTLADQSPNMIYINKKGTIVYANRKCEEIMGYTEAEITSPDFDFMTLVAPESADRIRQNYARHLRGEEVPQYEYTALTKSGEKIELINSTKLIQYEGETAVLGIVTDITERKRAVEALQQSENKFRTIFESAATLIISVNNEGTIVDCNNRIKEILGYEKEEIIGQSMAKIIHPDYLEKAQDSLKEILSAGSAQNKESKMIRKDGSTIDVCSNSTALKDEDGKAIRTLCIIDDITERKQARQRLIEDRKQLKSLASQLSLTEERERQRLATELHDQVGQSLVISKVKLDQLRQLASPGESTDTLKEVCGYLEQIIRDTRTLTFDLSYPILYELGIEAAVAEWLVDEIQEKHGIETEFEDDNQSKPLGDDIKAILFRNVRELLINVVKHASATNVRVSIRRVNEHVHISVSDDGVGFDPVKVEATAAGKAAFGLFSIRARLEQLGGFIEIDAEPGRGSRISMTAPLKQTETDDAPQASR